MAKKINLILDQAADFSIDLPLTDQNGDPLNLSGFTANSAMRRSYTSNTFIDFNVSVNSIGGIITLKLGASVSANLYPGRYVYDVNLNNGVIIF